MKTSEHYIGLMSGTSLDAVDAVLVSFSPEFQLIDALDTPLPQALRSEILALNSPATNELERSLILDKQLALLFSELVQQLLKKNRLQPAAITAIGSHGQTLRHAPNGRWGYSHQIGNGNVLAEQTGITVVADFRGRDIAAGGQGAPLVPAFHHAMFHSTEEARAIINIGGMANITTLSRHGQQQGFDTGPGNVLMDNWAQQHLGQRFDKDGEWARSGRINSALLQAMLETPFFQLPPPKSTGREQFDQHWLEGFLADRDIAPEDIQATLLELTAQSICNSLAAGTEAIYLCGGGAYNLYLKERIHQLSRLPVADTSRLGIAPEWVEAAAFAWLARQTMHQASGNQPGATGARGERILGCIYPR